MYKNFKLSEQERKQIMEMHQSHGYKKPLNEDMDASMEEPKEETPAEKIEDVVNNNPKFQNSIEAMVAALSDEEKEELQNALQSNGITASSSADEVHNLVSQPQEGGEQDMGEMHDAEKGSKKEFRNKVADILHSVGAGNIAAWGGVPAAIAIGATMGSVATGFAISWGATAVLMALAKAINPNVDKMNENEQEVAEGNGSLNSDEFMFHCKRLGRALEELKEAMRRGNPKAISEMKDIVQREFRRFKYSVDELESVLRKL